MEIDYVAFLKSKQNEIHAVSDLEKNILCRLVPFFDYPKSQKGDRVSEMGGAISRLSKKFKKHLGDLREFYFDIYDISDDLVIEGVHLYQFLLKQFAGQPLIPVVSVDRSSSHQDSVIKAKELKYLMSNTVAFRVTPEDFQSFTVISEDIADMLDSVFCLFESVDLVFDCRICTGLDAKKISKQIDDFTRRFSSIYSVRRVIVAGSSIPASIADVLSSNSEEFVDRKEIEIFTNAKNLGATNYLFGDYATISPDYSDVDMPPEQLHSAITAKFIYSFGSQHYFIRGGSLKTKGRDQYYDLAEILCSKIFFRGPEYSKGDAYFYEKSLRKGDQCWVTTVIRPAINAHITYSVNDLLSDNLI